jgi:transposase
LNMKKLKQIILSSNDRRILNKHIMDKRIHDRKRLRFQIVSVLSNGNSAKYTAEYFKISLPTVYLWQKRFLSLGFSGLTKDAQLSGRPPIISEEKKKTIIRDVMQKQKKSETWSHRSLAKSHSVSEATVRRLLKKQGYQSPSTISKKAHKKASI